SSIHPVRSVRLQAGGSGHAAARGRVVAEGAAGRLLSGGLFGGRPPVALIPRDELVEEARLPLEEPLRVEGVGQLEVAVVEVMADLVQQRAQEGPEGD